VGRIYVAVKIPRQEPNFVLDFGLKNVGKGPTKLFCEKY
jgi:hypothetical protein